MSKPIDVAAIYADAVTMMLTQHGIRFAFCEHDTENVTDTRCRSVIYMPLAVAERFKRVLEEIMEKAKEKKPDVVPPQRRKQQ